MSSAGIRAPQIPSVAEAGLGCGFDPLQPRRPTPSLCPTHTHLLLHQFELLLEPGVVPILLQPDPLGLLPAAHGMVLLHLLHLLLLLTLQVLQLRVKELLLGLEGAEGEI